MDIVPIDKADDLNVIVGQAHFIKTVDDWSPRRSSGAESRGRRRAAAAGRRARERRRRTA
jgi:hypothetical protein